MNNKKPKLLLSILVSFSLLFGAEAKGQITLLHTDRQCYVSGDLVFFKAIVKQTNDEIRENDVILYIDIVNRDNVFVNGEIIKLNKGLANGFISIPDSVKTGYYFVRVYTHNSIKNNQSKFLSTKQLFVSNRFGNNDEKYDSDSMLFKSSNNTIKSEVNDKLCLMETDDSVYNKRSKVTVNLQFGQHDFSDTVWAALSVKSVATCELGMEGIDFSKFENSISKSHESVDFVQEGSNLYENKGMIVSGYVNHKITGNPLSNILVLIAFEDSIIRLKYGITDSTGHFSFLFSDCYEKQVVYLSAYSYPERVIYPDAAISIDSKFLDQHQIQEGNRQVVGYEMSSDSLNVLKSIIAKAYNISYFNEQQSNSSVEQSFENLYLAGDFKHEVYIDDYVDLPDFIQITREILPFTRLRKNDKKYVFSVVDGTNNTIRDNPAVFVDGVPLTDINTILSWGSDKIKRVQTQSEPRYLGNVSFENGLVLIWTKKMDFWSNVENKNTFIYAIPCFQKPVQFSFPNYSKPSESIQPDFRQILYWEPSVVLEKNKNLVYEFYTSDEVGAYEIILRGITNDSKAVYAKKYIQVK